MTSVNVHLSGPARKKLVDDSKGITEFSEKIVHYDETITDAAELHRLASKKSAARKAEHLLPDEYALEQRTWDDWDCSLNANAVEIADLAEEIADDSEEWGIIDVLTFWLQSFDSMRVRRALHSELESAGVEVVRVD